ncbi:uncharacterized protein [Periplaneta americana]|uniref:uncharacterized protein n=1 Tax=Periplaneta americana TaxID=6978 RepID=UPI0037E95ABA
MGSSPSKREGGCLGRRQGSKGHGEVKLPGSRLRFSREQLQRLNLHLTRLEQHNNHGGSGDLSRERASAAVEVVVERLIQRLVCGAAMLDPRFSSKFLATFDGMRDRSKPGQSPRFEYLVRLDALSSPSLYPDGGTQPTCRVVEGMGGDGAPQGFAKIRLQGEGAEQWAEFINPAGFLRRDKIQERFVEILAQAAAKASEPVRPDHVDESRLCGSPGKIVDVGILDQLLRIPPERQVYYGSADCNQSRFPDPRDFRIAIVEGAPEVRLRIGFLSPALAGSRAEDVEVKLILGVGCAGWPQSSDFPGRAPLGHIDCLLFQKAAQTGFYLVPGPPHPTVRCDDRTATWQVWVPAAELALLTHYSASSVPSRVLRVLETALQQLRGRTTRDALGGLGLPITRNQEFLKVVSRYMVRTMLWFQMEKDNAGPAAMLLSWTPDTLAGHVLQVLDALVVALRTQRFRSYFFPWCNVMLHSPAGGQHHPEEDYLSDADIIEGFLRCLHEESSIVVVPAEDDDDIEMKRYLISERLETCLIRKWGTVLTDLAPPATTRSRRLSFGATTNGPVTYTTAGATQYTPRQLDYIAQLFREMLRVRQLTLQNQSSPAWFPGHLQTSSATIQQEDPVEDLIYLLTAILEQAKELALGDMGSMPSTGGRCRKRSASKKTVRRNLGTKVDSGNKIRNNFDASVIILVDSVRRDIETSNADLSDDSVLVRHVLKWLYRGLDEDKKHLAPVLRPYLNRLFAASHENGWHLEEWNRRQNEDHGNEMRVLGSYCRLVINSEASPSTALVDAVGKGWVWAENMLDMAEYLGCSDITCQPEVGLQLVFTPDDGKVVRHNICLPSSVEHLQVPESRYSTFSSTKSTYSRNKSASNTLKMKKATLSRGATVTLPSLLAQQPRNLLYQGLGNCASVAAIGHQPPPHCRLRDASPLTLLLDARRRYGHQRGVGDIVQALISLQKFSVLQEVSALLPDDERVQMLDAIQKLSKETRRAIAARRARATTLQANNGATVTNRTLKNIKKKSSSSSNPETKLPQIFRPNEDFLCYSSEQTQLEENRNSLALKQQENIAQREKELTKALDKVKADNTLLGTCRAVRSQHGTSRHSFLGGASAFNGSLFLDTTPSLPLARETSLTMHFTPFGSSSYEGMHNSNVALLQLTDDKQLRLAQPQGTLIHPALHVDVRVDKALSRKRDIVTKL